MPLFFYGEWFKLWLGRVIRIITQKHALMAPQPRCVPAPRRAAFSLWSHAPQELSSRYVPVKSDAPGMDGWSGWMDQLRAVFVEDH